MLASRHKQPVPIFQQLARGHPSGRDDVRAVPAVVAQCRQVYAAGISGSIFIGLISTLRVGDGLADGTNICPMINNAAIAKIERHVSDATAKGARVATGGRALDKRYFEPTLLTEATCDMLIAGEETFGPVAPLFRFRTEEEAIEMANDTPYGLARRAQTGRVSTREHVTTIALRRGECE
jgi:acyl-CoA reductase-like NAD-dependent aldehyde dehydrogenase